MILNENQIKKIVIEVTITYFKRWKLSDSLIQNISHQVFLICQKQEIEDKIEASRIVKSYLRDCIEHTLFGNPNSKLNNIFFNPYKEYYDHVNKEYHFEDCETNYKLFIDSVIDTIYEGIRESYYYRFRKSLESNYYKKRKIYERKTNNETPKYIPKYYETIFKGSKDLLREMMSYLSVEEKEIFESATFMNYQFLPILRKINNGIKAYFMVTYLKYDPEKKKKTILDAMDKNQQFTVINQLQNEFFQTFACSKKEFLDLLSSNSLSNKKRNLLVFLGIEIYNLEPDIKQNPNDLIREAIKDTKDIIYNYSIKKGLYLTLKEYDSEYILDALEYLKNQKKDYYQIILLKNGNNFMEDHPLNSKDYLLYQYGIASMKRYMNKKMEERKQTIKALLKNSKKNLYLIKERRRNCSILDLSYKYHIPVDSICDIFSKNILLFGIYKDDVLKEIEDFKLSKNMKDS